jgi:hypothetical protein
MITSRVNAAAQARFTVRFTPAFTLLVVLSASARLTYIAARNGEIRQSG